MNILGISAFYHDSAAIVLKDGQIVCAAEEERFTRIKHDNNFPFNAVKFCLKESGLSIEDIDCVAYYEKPLKKFERILENFIKTYPFSLMSFVKGIPEWLGNKIKVERIIKKELGYPGRISFVPHHLSHASAVFFSSGFDQAAVLTVDGVGEFQTTCLWAGNKNEIILLKSLDFPDSLGLFYSTFTAFLGFKVNEDEYKVMGMAAYGQPNMTDKIYSLISVKNDGSFKLNMEYFGFRAGSRMWSNNFQKLFGPPRKTNEAITQYHRDLAASVQKVLEKVYYAILNHLFTLVPSTRLVVSGGVGLNALANGKIFSRTPFKEVYILGTAGDSGAAVGSALLVSRVNNEPETHKAQTGLSLGSEYTSEQIAEALEAAKLPYRRVESGEKLIEWVSHLLNNGKVIGWFQGRMEFGPRALGNRSILAKPNPRNVKEKVNEIKRREQFRPFAGSILKECAAEYFEIPDSQDSFPFMNFCFKVKSDKRGELTAIVHEDTTCRIQTVSSEDGRYYQLLRKFHEISGIPCLLNTSFNLGGEPIVETPAQALDDFMKSDMDYLAIGDFMVSKYDL